MDDALTIKKGRNRDVESYSAFFDNARQSSTGLVEQLRQKSVTDVIVCGLATDVCVGKKQPRETQRWDSGLGGWGAGSSRLCW